MTDTCVNCGGPTTGSPVTTSTTRLCLDPRCFTIQPYGGVIKMPTDIGPVDIMSALGDGPVVYLDPEDDQ